MVSCVAVTLVMQTIERDIFIVDHRSDLIQNPGGLTRLGVLHHKPEGQLNVHH